jgi:hypothetical protein
MTDEYGSTPAPPKIDSEIQAAAEALSDLGKERDPILASQLARIMVAVAREASRSSRFAKALGAALDPDKPYDTIAGEIHRPRRRAPGLLDPFAIYAESGEDGLRERLTDLNLEQLRDILAEHRLDHDRLAMKWKDSTRVIDRIVERVIARAYKGSAFRT